MNIKLLVEGGDMKPGPVVGQQLGPAGINIGKVIQQVNQETASFKGMKVPVTIHVDTKTKNFTLSIASPPVSELLKKEAGTEKGSGEHAKLKAGNLAIEQIIAVTKIKYQNMLARDFISAVKSVIGSTISLGLLIENKEAKEILREVEKGAFSKEIKDEKTTLAPEKKQLLADFFNSLKMKQEEALKKEAEAKAVAEEAAKSAAPAQTAAATQGKPEKAPTGKPEAAKAAAPVKPGEKAPTTKPEAKKQDAKKK